VTTLAAAGADVNAPQESGATPLTAAAGLYDSPRVVAALAAAGADVSRPDADGFTPLVMACRRGLPGVAAALVAAGADVDQVHFAP